MKRTRPRRILAFAVDCVIITAWAGLIALVSFALGAGASGAPADPADKVVAWVVALLTLTLPVIGVSAFLEARSGATPGKRLLGIHVGRLKGGPPGFRQSLLRNGVKYAPWELGHIGIWTVPGTPFAAPPGWWNLLLWAAAMGAMVVQAALILASGSGVHDRLARTLVRSQPRHP